MHNYDFDSDYDSRKDLIKRYEALRQLQLNEGWVTHWEDLQAVFAPRRGRFVGRGETINQKYNRGKKKHQNIINSTPIRASNTLAAGMMAGMTSPARPWFNLTFDDPDIAKFGPVRNWLAVTEQRIREFMLKSNIYKMLPLIYKDLGIYGTAALGVQESMETLFHTRAFEIGSYFLATNEENYVDTIMREEIMTVKQIYQKFGHENVSSHVKKLYDAGSYYHEIDVIHAIFPNPGYDEEKKLSTDGKKFLSIYMEKDCDSKEDSLLQKKGFDDFPVMAPRWISHGVDVYGSSPGMDALGDNRSMQLKEKRKDRVIDKISDPPMVAPSSAVDVSMVPGDVTFIDGPVGNQKFEPALIIDPRAVPELRADIQDAERRIQQAFYVDLFMMLTMTDRREITAREIEERHEEKLLMLGPVLESIQGELLDPLIDRVFNLLNRNGLIPIPPREIQNKDLKVDYISILAQAQKAVATAAIKDMVGYVGGLTQFDPQVLDKIKLDVSVDKFADARGVPPEIVRDDDEVEKIRAERQAKQAQAMAVEQANTSSQTAKNLAQAKVKGGESTALDEMLGAGGGPAG
jgi:hypothetical protein